MLREQRVRDQNVCSLCDIIPGLSLLQRTRPGVLPYRPRAPREAARVCLASSSPEKAGGGVTGLLRHAGTKGNGHHGGFPRQIVEAWHVQCSHALRSGAFDNMKSHRFCILPGSEQLQSVRGHLEALQCCGVDVVGATCLLSARKPLRVWSEKKDSRVFITSVSVSANAINAISAIFFDKELFFSSKIFEKNKSFFFCLQEKPLFSHASGIA